MLPRSVGFILSIPFCWQSERQAEISNAHPSTAACPKVPRKRSLRPHSRCPRAHQSCSPGPTRTVFESTFSRAHQSWFPDHTRAVFQELKSPLRFHHLHQCRVALPCPSGMKDLPCAAPTVMFGAPNNSFSKSNFFCLLGITCWVGKKKILYKKNWIKGRENEKQRITFLGMGKLCGWCHIMCQKRAFSALLLSFILPQYF